MKKFAVSAAIAVLAMAAAGSANAAVETLFTPTVATPTPGYTVIDTFNTLTGVTGTGTFILSSATNDTGADPDESPAPAPPYLDVEGGATALITFSALTNAPVHAFEFDWGSVDTFNTLTIHVSGGPDVLIVPPAPGNGSWTSGDTNGTFQVWGTAGETFTGITLATTEDSFEIDNLAINGVPEPASWAMMILGFGAIGFAMRRRSRMVAAG
jgi:hypothetical protein